MGRGLQAKHKIEDKLELIICLFLYICLKTKCKLNKVIAELGKRGEAFLSQTADTPDFIISRGAKWALQMCSPWALCGNDFPERDRRRGNNSTGWSGTKPLILRFVF